MRNEAMSAREISLQGSGIDLLFVSDDKLAVRNASQRINGVGDPRLNSVKPRIRARGRGYDDMFSFGLPWQYIRAQGRPAISRESPD